MAQLGGMGASFAEGGAQGRMYGPVIGGAAEDDQGAYLRPGSKLAPRAVTVPAPPAAPVLLAEINPRRKSLTVSNPNGPTIWVGDDPSMQPGPTAGANSFPVVAGGVVAFEPREYIGPLYALVAVGSAAAVVYVAEPFV